MTKGAVTLFMESTPMAKDLVAGLLNWGYTQSQISKMTYLSNADVRQIMLDFDLHEITIAAPLNREEG